ncbi:hypothetical protein [Oscillibacter sp.]|uniref:hypothetical protein n=1 Tax=Oscillibacter sp. TaxID=1945593 RepID=UPI0028982F0A|nr:hypothetical protein [Oscillibacter sp.]
MKYNWFDLKIYRKFHKIIEKSQLRLTCSDQSRLFSLTRIVRACPVSGQAGRIFPALIATVLSIAENKSGEETTLLAIFLTSV